MNVCQNSFSFRCWCPIYKSVPVCLPGSIYECECFSLQQAKSPSPKAASPAKEKAPPLAKPSPVRSAPPKPSPAKERAPSPAKVKSPTRDRPSTPKDKSPAKEVAAKAPSPPPLKDKAVSQIYFYSSHNYSCIGGLVQECSISSVSAIKGDILQSCSKPSIPYQFWTMWFTEDFRIISLQDHYLVMNSSNPIKIWCISMTNIFALENIGPNYGCHLLGAKPLPEPMMLIVSWTLKNKHHELLWNLNQNTNIFIQENAFEDVICQMCAILFC